MMDKESMSNTHPAKVFIFPTSIARRNTERMRAKKLVEEITAEIGGPKQVGQDTKEDFELYDLLAKMALEDGIKI